MTSGRGASRRTGTTATNRRNAVGIARSEDGNSGGGFAAIPGTQSSILTTTVTSAVDCSAAGSTAAAAAVAASSTAAAIDEATAAAVAAAAAAYPYVDMSMYEDYLRPIYQDGDVLLEVECGDNQGLLYLSRLCQGSKGPCILFNHMWLTPNEFQYISGRETAKDWKRSIRHHGKSMKLLLSKGILAVHPPICDCDGCRISSPVNRCGRVSDSTKRALSNAAIATTAEAIVAAPADINNGSSRRGSNARNKKNVLGLPASGYSDHVHELQVLIAQTQRQAEQLQKNMDSMKKNEQVNKSPEPAEKKRESRLTSIIDQLLSNKARGLKEEAAKSNNTISTSATTNPASTNSLTAPVTVDIPANRTEEPINSDDNSSEDRREVSSTSSATSSTSGDSVSSSVSLDSGQSEISTGSSLDAATANCSSKNSSYFYRQADNKTAAPTKAEGSNGDHAPTNDPATMTTNATTNAINKNKNSRSRKKGSRTKDSSFENVHNGFAESAGGPSATSSAFVTHSRRSDACADSLPLAQLRAFAAAAASEPKLVHNNNNSGSGGLLGIATMPGDTLLVDPSKIKSERLTPDLMDSSNSPLASPRSSPRSISSSASRAHHHHLLAQAPALGLEHLSPAALLAASAGGCGTPPVLKQMEQMVSRNYSDIMRSLAAKYNNSNNNDRYNGLEQRKFDGRFPTPPLLGLSKSDVEGVRKNENHSAPPVLGEQRSPGSVVGGRCFGGGGGNLAPSMMDMSSSQVLLNMVRSASAVQNASQLETYLRGTIKRPASGSESETFQRTDPLDLTISSSKKPRIVGMDGLAATYDASAASAACMAAAAAALSLRLPGTDQMATSIKPPRDFRELLGKREEHSQADPAPRTPGTSPKPGEARTPKAESPQPNKNKSASSSPSTTFNTLPCMSLCLDGVCSPGSQAERMAHWSVDDVCKFVASIDTCSEYVQTFREQSIDGAALPMLTEEHLINNMNMKLGPVLKLRSTLAKKIGHCPVCMHCFHCHGSTNENRRPNST